MSDIGHSATFLSHKGTKLDSPPFHQPRPACFPGIWPYGGVMDATWGI